MTHLTRRRRVLDHVLAFGALLLILMITVAAHAQTTLLNVSYDPTRELYKALNQAFAADWKAKTGETVTIRSRTAARASRRAR